MLGFARCGWDLCCSLLIFTVIIIGIAFLVAPSHGADIPLFQCQDGVCLFPVDEPVSRETDGPIRLFETSSIASDVDPDYFRNHPRYESIKREAPPAVQPPALSPRDVAKDVPELNSKRDLATGDRDGSAVKQRPSDRFVDGDGRPVVYVYGPTANAVCEAMFEEVFRPNPRINVVFVKTRREDFPELIQDFGREYGYPVIHYRSPRGVPSLGYGYYSLNDLIEAQQQEPTMPLFLGRSKVKARARANAGPSGSVNPSVMRGDRTRLDPHSLRPLNAGE